MLATLQPNLHLPLSSIDLPSEFVNDDDKDEEEHFNYVKVGIGLLYLSWGCLDECHALVTPLSWHDDTAFGYGYPTQGTSCEAVATHAHCLVHRYEGSNIGELNLSGYSNANY